MRLPLVVAILAAGCTPLPVARTWDDLPSAACVAWRERHIAWGATAAASGVLSGAGGLATLAPEAPAVKVGIGIAALALGSLTTAAQVAAGEYAAAYVAHGCVDRRGVGP